MFYFVSHVYHLDLTMYLKVALLGYEISMNLAEFYKLITKQGFQFSTDTRLLKQGDVYFALTGPNFNGNKFAQQALESGASYAVVDDPDLEGKPGCISVENVLQFMQKLARYHRDQFDIPVLAIGGSNGKTTTKELILSVLSQKYKVHGTAGNLNNLIGVPVTLLKMPADTEIAVIEIGTNTFGEIKDLCNIVDPDHGIITNIGKEHLEGFGDLEGVAREESELYLYLKKRGGIAFVNNEDDHLQRMSVTIERRHTYGIRDNADCQAEAVQVMPNISLKLGDKEIHSKLFGEYNLSNIMAAIAIGRFFEVSDAQIKEGVESYVPSNNRSEIRQIGTNTVILDSYNANPSSMEAAMNSFAKLKGYRKIVVLGDMFELGKQAEVEHMNIARLAAENRFDQIILVGEWFAKQAGSIGAKGFENIDQAITYLRGQNLKDSWMLVKGSRGMKMERIMEIWDPSDAIA